MIKKLFSILLIGSAAAGGFAATPTFDFTYADGDYFAYGKGKKENIDVAICIDNPTLEGMKLTGIKAYISTTEDISNTSVWLTKELKLENKINLPDIESYEVTPAKETIEGYDLGVLSITLPEPYVFTSEPVYVGYSLTVDNTPGDAQKKPVVLSPKINPNGLYIHMSKSVLKWASYSENAGGVAFIVATIEGDLPDNSLSLNSYNTIYAEPGKDFDVTFSAFNTGLETIKSIGYTYSFDGGATENGSVELQSPMNPSLSNSTLLTLPFKGVEGTGAHDLVVTVTEVNGNANESNNATIACVVNVIPFVPVHRPLVEEFTGLWCGWCPRGYIAMELIAEDYGDSQVSICYHNGDPMEVTKTFPVNVTGFPSASLDRLSVIDPYYGSGNAEFGIADEMLALMDQFTNATVDVTATLEDNIINVEGTASFVQDMEGANYQMGYVLIANGLTNPEWSQANYFAGSSGYNGTPLEILTTWDAQVFGLVFNDVAIEVSAMSGVEKSIPASIKTAEAYTSNYKFDISNNKLVQDRNNLVVAAFVIDKNTNFIVNANKCAVKQAGVESIMTSKEVIDTEYYDLTGRKVVNPSKGIFVKVSKYSDGTKSTSKVMLSR